MEESTTASPVTEAGDESPAQKQARIRRERREAKIKAGGSARLDKITQLSGRPPPDLIPPPYQSPAASNDPDEVDITNHPYTSSRGSPSPRFGQNNGPTEADLRQLLRSGAPPPNMGQNPFMMPGQQGQGDGGAGGGNEDPMMRILQQMMGGISGGEGGAGGGGLPPELAAMLGGGGAGGQPQQEDKHGYLWSIIHGLFALSLGIYTLGTYQFDGSRISRTPLDSSQSSPAGIFWIFTTVELILQSSRFFLEKGAMGQRGMLAMVANFLPMPWKGYVALISRYGSIYTRVVEDAMVIVFVLGLVAWWQGAVA